MHDLSEKYLATLQKVATDIQNSDILAEYNESEEEVDYKTLCDVYEPQIAKVYFEVAAEVPLQLIALENVLLNPYFEGLYSPRILGYSILRGQVNDQARFVRPQSHFFDILNAILESPHFENLKKRIGQTIQMGFAFSGDIRVTDFIDSVKNKKLIAYLQSQKIEKLRDLTERTLAFNKYKNQFVAENYLTAVFPDTFGTLKVEYPDLKTFLLYRVSRKLKNDSLKSEMLKALDNPAFLGTNEHAELLLLTINFLNLNAEETKHVASVINAARQKDSNFPEKYLGFLLELFDKNITPDSSAEIKAATFLDSTIKDDVSKYYTIANVVHAKGYPHPDVMQVVKVFYDSHNGKSTINECLRRLVGSYIKRLIKNLTPREYFDFFESFKIFQGYMRIFENEHFNQSIRDASIDYTERCFKQFIDKRSKEYQDVKKFIRNQFVEANFIKDKDAKEKFKVKRKPKS